MNHDSDPPTHRDRLYAAVTTCAAVAATAVLVWWSWQGAPS
ncbi:MAG: hypothetical protein QM658_10700 [Gordonia sp. (in: high G+C Gram-positive bacteria)]